MHDVLEDIEVIGFRGFDDAVEDSAGIGAVCNLTEQPVFAADEEGLYCPFTAVVVYAQLSILCIAL